MGLVGLLAVLVGFSKTFIHPISTGNFKAPVIIYIHAAFAFSWIMLFVIQTFLIRFNKTKTHMQLGVVGLFIAIGVAVTIIPAGLHVVEKELKQGLGEVAISGIVGNCTSALMFLVLVLAGIYYRKNPQTHKRLLLLATIIVLWPAWFRFRHFFPSIDRPEIWFAVVLADSLIVISWIRDKLIIGRVHQVFLYIGTFIILENCIELVLFDTPIWRQFAIYIYGMLT